MAALKLDLPVIPIHVNCRVSPALTGRRVRQFGVALGKAIALNKKRVGVLASGGLSGEPNGYMAGWMGIEAARTR